MSGHERRGRKQRRPAPVCWRMRLAYLSCVLPLLFGSVLACSGAGAEVPGGGPGGSSGEGSSGTDGTSSSSGSTGSSGSTSSSSGGSSGDPDPTPKETKVGTITITSTAYKVGTTPVEMGSAWGSFYRIPPQAPGGPSTSSCTTNTTGACTVNACTFGSSAPADGGAPAIAYTHAGVAKVTGVLVNDGSMTLTPGGYGYQTVSGSVAFFKGGESVGVSAPGNPNGAPAFDVKLTAPSSIVVTAPVFDAQSRVSVGAGKNLAVGWQNAAGGEVAVQISSGTSAKSAIARCAFPAGAGQGVVPSSVLAAVGAVGGQTSITVSAESRAVKNPDGWDITVTLQAYGIRAGASGGIASGLLQIQ